MLDRNVLNDDVLFDLLKMGILDWEAPNNRLNQTTPARRHATAMQMRLLAKHLDLEAKVGPSFCAIEPQIDDAFSAIDWKQTSRPTSSPSKKSSRTTRKRLIM